MTFSAKKNTKENRGEMKNRICLTRRHSVCVVRGRLVKAQMYSSFSIVVYVDVSFSFFFSSSRTSMSVFIASMDDCGFVVRIINITFIYIFNWARQNLNIKLFYFFFSYSLFFFFPCTWSYLSLLYSLKQSYQIFYKARYYKWYSIYMTGYWQYHKIELVFYF
jgi:hypothetical protein